MRTAEPSRVHRLHDVRSEPVGGWAGPIGPDEPVGKYAGPPRRRRQAAGGWSGEPDRQRQGSFADAEPMSSGLRPGLNRHAQP
jgi:hypothetical protein